MDIGVNEKPNLLKMLKDKKDDLISVKDAQLELDVSLSSVYRYIEEGKLMAIRKGRRNILVFRSSLKEYLDSLNPLLLE